MSKEAMTLALEALNLVNLEFVCDGAHHAKKDRHEFGDDCPVTARYQLAIKALEEALAKQEQGEPVVCCQEYDTCLKPCTPRGEHLAKQEQGEPVAWMWSHKTIEKVGVYFEDPAIFFDMKKPSDYEWTALYTKPQPPQKQEQGEPVALDEYDAGLLSDYGGGNVEWWQDYIRGELGRAYKHYQSQIPPQPKQEHDEPVALPVPDVISEKTDEPYAYSPALVRKILLVAQQPSQKPWVGLTEKERNDIEDWCEMMIGKPAFEAIEAKLKEKNT